MTALRVEPRRVSTMLVEARKLPAFMRRDLLVLLSYRVAFVSDLLSVAIQATLFGFLGQLVDESQLPQYGGEATAYFEYVMIGVLVTAVSGLLLQRVATAMRAEQLTGTLEALLITPTAPGTVQAGSIAFDLFFVPVRMSLLLLAVTFMFGLGFSASGVLPSAVVMVVFVPFIWGLGLLAAAAIVTFRRGAGLVAVAMSLLGIVSGAFFPLSLLPDWLQGLAEANPVAVTLEALRHALIGGEGWQVIGLEVALLVPVSAFSVFAGAAAFRAALAREHRRGTLGLY
jgi:ABC-2 type transport system permease protein